MTAIRVLAVGVGAESSTALAHALESDGDICVVTTDPQELPLASITGHAPDVVILDGRADFRGLLDTIADVMAHAPRPILVLTGASASPADVSAIVAAGALQSLPRPVGWTAAQGLDLRHTVRQLSRVRVIRHPRGARKPLPSPAQQRSTAIQRRPVVAVAASTGGPAALATIVAELGGLDAPVLIVQHLHAEFTGGMVEWMRRAAALPVEVAEPGMAAEAGRIFLAPAGAHLRLDHHFHLTLDPKPSRVHCPSADELFLSVATVAGAAGVGVLLTGMGDDGARGLLSMRQRGARTLAQDAASCAVNGMPQAARRLGAVTASVPLSGVAAEIRRAVDSLHGAHQ